MKAGKITIYSEAGREKDRYCIITTRHLKYHVKTYSLLSMLSRESLACMDTSAMRRIPVRKRKKSFRIREAENRLTLCL